MISGILAIDKSLGWTSHDVVARIRRVSGQRQVGHAGTLDPLATGLLLVVLGRATRLSSYLMSGTKEYRALVVLGVSTTTDDSESEIKQQCDPSNVSRDELERCLSRFVGTIEQHPPQYSAVRQDGQKLYAMARQGTTVETRARTVTIRAIDLEKFEPPGAWLRIRCESGTYIRSLARDFGQELGVGAYLHALRRTRSGRFDVVDAKSLDSLSGTDQLRDRLLPADYALVDHPALLLDDKQIRAIQMGQAIGLEPASESEPDPANAGHEEIRLYEASGRLVALGRRSVGVIRPFRVFEEFRR
jgi:tRNA pseudouridine55 synthase